MSLSEKQVRLWVKKIADADDIPVCWDREETAPAVNGYMWLLSESDGCPPLNESSRSEVCWACSNRGYFSIDFKIAVTADQDVAEHDCTGCKEVVLKPVFSNGKPRVWWDLCNLQAKEKSKKFDLKCIWHDKDAPQTEADAQTRVSITT